VVAPNGKFAEAVRVDATDRQIDRFAHELYGLSDEEIAWRQHARTGRTRL